jgi:peptidoglycan/LPS O-acetylase OafA/YrhL
MRLTPERYRADIDGLRALSVIAVILFHADCGLSGGFVGVDVFFVISGYLITRLIAADLDRGTFSLAAFWDRRLRRIWPAALVLTTAALAAGWFLLLPQDFHLLASDSLAHIAMLANVRYWAVIDYFAPAAELRPLLHTWSLAVEEQFYVFFPLVMMLAWRWGRTSCIWVCSLLAAGSFTASVLLIGTKPMDVFFLLPHRAWELLVGALVALAAPRGGRASPELPPQRAGWSAEFAGIIGFFMIALPCVLYDRQTPFPALAAVPPCLGAVLVIIGGDVAPTSTVGRLLASPPLRGVGLMSYSLYLWHWPVLAFMRYYAGLRLPLPWLLAAVPIVGACSYLSWRFIETPFRRRGAATSAWRTFVFAGAAALALAVCCQSIRGAKGIPGRFSPAVLELLAPFSLDWEYGKHTRSGEPTPFPLIGRRSADACGCLMLWGDSHGLAIGPALDEAARDLGITGVAAVQIAALPLPGAWQPNAGFFPIGGRRESQEWSTVAMDWIRTCRPRHVMLCARWSMYLSGGLPDKGDKHLIAPLDVEAPTRDSAAAALEHGVRRLMAVCEETNTDVWVLLEIPYQPAMPRRLALAEHWWGEHAAATGISRAEHEHSQRVVREAFTPLAGGRLHVVDLAEPFFLPDGSSQVGRDGAAWYADEGHLNPTGAREALGPLLRHLLAPLAADCGPR